MKKVYSFLTSLPFMAFLFLALAFSMAIATFVESSYGTPAARSLIYNTGWFEALWALFALNLFNNLFKYRLLTKRRFTIGLFHVAFLVMLLGAAITRWLSYEGSMHIRENDSSNTILSSDATFFAGVGNQNKEKTVRFSEITPRQFSAKFDVGGQKVEVKTIGYFSHSERKAIPSESGESVIDLVFAAPDRQGMQSFTFRRGDVLEYPGLVAGFEARRETPIRFFMRDGELKMIADYPVEETTMATQETVTFAPGDTIDVKKMFLYGVNNFRLLVRDFLPSATFTAVRSAQETNEQAVLVEVSDGVRKQTIPVFGHSGMRADTVEVPLSNTVLKLAYGAKIIHLPFRLFLKDFQLERYPGSESPSSYASEVVLIDDAEGVKRDVRIFMNNTLLYKGYKFFQSSYDQDELGTVLSVNYDLWGTWISYISYILLGLGFALSLLNKNSYFRFLAQRLKQTSAKTIAVVVLSTGFAFSASAQIGGGTNIPPIDPQLSDAFSKLWVQGADGRIEPLSTLNSEIVRKLSRKSSLYGKSADEVVLSMMAYPEIWQTLPFVRVGDKALSAELGISGKTIAVQQMFDAQGNYRIAEQVRAAFSKPAAMRNQLEKEYIYLDERVSICFMVFRGTLFNIFPRERIEDSWYSPGENALEYSGGDSIFIKSGVNLLVQSIQNGNSTEALDVLSAVSNFQLKYGGDLLPGQAKKSAEILYNKVNPFERIFPFYLLFGFFLLVVLIANIFRLKPLPVALKKTFFFAILFLFVVHTAGIILRWYISGRAPWSNGYESVIYVAWAAMLAGVLFGRKYPLVVGTAAFLTGISLFVAHLSWMNPEITPLVPVLKSYWLTIHVSIITASYGFFGLSAFLGILVLVLIVIRRTSNEGKVNQFIEQLTTINEMSITVGLYFLTIGTFLGGVWANESWGRYWGWDPKETWALITVMIYSFIAHMRLIPSLKGIYNYNIASVFGFASVLMTYFGVNYYLAGLHSYGKGVAGGMNPAVPVSLLLLAGLMIWAYLKDLKYEKQKEERNS
ncbi:cytochrome c-type biogenesis protein CcsB [Mariniphaga anaerophila]|uniref:Cytochrome c-type biogenesis protein CcsB n=1 Tax=Mariniphaga anaerophila TaxID=1484053 RepID=A0A1M5DM18_9BACT|nr:c-type cytochrome biogenesis protein CcsB [Mariniphaga anaerophila]SHF68068.1 cytochrome c-type biogenesis protein CcsB [Mariniphaga anaerophila]